MKARRRTLDPITGAPRRPGAPGSVSADDLVVVRGRLQVPVRDRDLDPHADRYGVRREAWPSLSARLAELARSARERPALARRRGPMRGVAYSSPKAAAAELYALNRDTFDALEYLDDSDIVRELLDNQRVGRKKLRPLSRTPLGRAAIESRRGATRIRAVLAALLSTSRTRRWRDAPWGEILEYFHEAVANNNENAAQQGAAGVGAPSFVYPIGSGQLTPSEQLAQLEALDPAAARRYAERLLADHLDELADQYEAIARVSQGDARTIAAERGKDLRRWARRPWLVSEETCDPDAQGCAFGSVRADLQAQQQQQLGDRVLRQLAPPADDVIPF